MLKITVIAVGKLKERYWQEACEEYIKRLSSYCAVRMVEVDDERAPEGISHRELDQIKNAEGDRIIRVMNQRSAVWALDVRGERTDSIKWSESIERLALSGVSGIDIIIGGSYGLSEAVLNRADRRISFSDMTFPHQMMRVILLEQLYRACKIARGEPYHK